MKTFDCFRVVAWNLKADKRRFYKMLFGMTIAMSFLLCFCIAFSSFYAYLDHININEKNSCYAYEAIDGFISLESFVKMKESEYREQWNDTSDTSSLVTLMDRSGPGAYIVKDIVLSIDEKKYLHQPRNARGVEKYKNLTTGFASLWIGYFYDGMNLFPEPILPDGCEQYLIGELPDEPGEILLDDYLLASFGVDIPFHDLVGMSCACLNETDGEKVFSDYRISGVLRAEYLGVRENMDAYGNLNHIYIDLRPEDMENFWIYKAVHRIYYPDFYELFEQYGNINVLSSNILPVNTEYGRVNRYLTTKGNQFCTICWILVTVGRLVIAIGIVSILVICFTYCYLLYFYRKRSERYRKMLGWIGMQKRDKRMVTVGEVLVILVLALVISGYVAGLFWMIFSYLIRQFVNFSFGFPWENYLLAVLGSAGFLGIASFFRFSGRTENDEN